MSNLTSNRAPSVVTPSVKARRPAPQLTGTRAVRALDHIVWVLLALFALVGYLLNPFFFSIANIQNILVQATTLGFLAVGIAFTLLIGEIDLSVVGILGFSGSVGALLANLGVPSIVTILCVIAIGTLLGLVNGLGVAVLGMNSLITTLAVGLTLSGAVLAITRGTTITITDPGYTYIGVGQWLSWPIMPVALILLFIAVAITFNKTRWGRQLFATGGNRRAAFAAGISTTRVRLSAFMLSGTLAGAAGWLATAYLSGVNATIASDMLLYAIAAPVIGGVSLMGGVGKVSGILGGILLITVVQVALQLSNISAYYISMAGGGMILVAVIIDVIRVRFARKA